jgi:hypothetical protein
MRYDVWFILVALIYLMAGEVFGEYMAATQDHSLFPAHAHLNVLGWVSLAIFGVVHHIFPQLGGSRLAMPQFAIAVISVPVMTFGIAYVLLTQNPLFAIAGSFAFDIATVLFVIMFVMRVVRIREV